MKLLPPQVCGPISECNSSIKVQGQLTGSTVSIFANSIEPIGGGVANWSEQVFFLTRKLTAADKITVMQSIDGVDSPQSPLPEPVQKAQSTLDRVAFATHLYQCAQAVYLTGAAPGSTVEVYNGPTKLGEANAPDGIARVSLSGTPHINERLTARQTGCGVTGPDSLSGPAEALPKTLMPPNISSPVKECQRAIAVNDAYPGASLVLRKNGAEVDNVVFDLPSLWWITDFKLGDMLSLAQRFPLCEKRSDFSTPEVKVEKNDNLPKPFLHDPLCEGGVQITLDNLIVGAEIIVYADADEIGRLEASQSSQTFYVTALKADTNITATQSLCKKPSEASNAVKVKRLNFIPSSPVIYDDLFVCSSNVKVSNAELGSIIYIESMQLGKISQYIQVYSKEIDVAVFPILKAGDVITVKEIACGGALTQSATLKVKPFFAEKLDAPTIKLGVLALDEKVTVLGAIQGAIVDLYLNSVFIQSAYAGHENTVFYMTQFIHKGDLISARQRFCNLVSNIGPAIPALAAMPLIPILDWPTNNQINLPNGGLRFTWTDPGMGTDRAATQFYLYLHKSTGEDVPVPTTTNNYFVLPSRLMYSTDYIWTVSSYNNSNRVAQVYPPHKFTTMPDPNAPQNGQNPRTAVLNFGASIFLTDDDNGQNSISPSVGQDFFAGINVINSGSGTSGGFHVTFVVWEQYLGGQTAQAPITIDGNSLAPTQAKYCVASIDGLAMGSYFIEATLTLDGVQGSITTYTGIIIP